MTNAFERFFNVKKFDYGAEKQKFINHMNYLKSMSVEEFTFYKKYTEVSEYRSFADLSEVVKSKIWQPTDILDLDLTIKEIEELDPVIQFIPMEDKRLHNEWLMLRIFGHSMDFDQNPGRFLKFSVIDRKTKKYLGITSIGSDVIAITDRDTFIGWSKDDRLEYSRLNNSAIGTCIMSTQPIGYNFLGGKLVASLLCTSEVRNTWERLYKDVLVGLTTTSLYGGYSMYNNIPYWKDVGNSKGRISLKPDDKYFDTWVKWLKENKTEEYDSLVTQKEGVSGPVTAVKIRVLNKIYQELGMKPSEYVHGFERGIYYAQLYSNTKEFLCRKIEKDKLIINPKLKNDTKGVIDWWRGKAISRYKKLHLENKLKPDILYYNEMMDMEWEEAKLKYLGEVGR